MALLMSAEDKTNSQETKNPKPTSHLHLYGSVMLHGNNWIGKKRRRDITLNKSGGMLVGNKCIDAGDLRGSVGRLSYAGDMVDA